MLHHTNAHSDRDYVTGNESDENDRYWSARTNSSDNTLEHVLGDLGFDTDPEDA